MEQHNGLFGLRLSHGLHLGHLVGNVRPAINDQNERIIIVVLADLFTYTSDRRDDITLKNVLSMTAELMALGLNSDNVKFVIQSKAFHSLSPLFAILCCLLKVRTLKSTQPIKKMLENDVNLHLGELTFPIMQCAEMISTHSEVLYSNTDNLGIATLTKNLYKKIERYTNISLPSPRLCHGEMNNVLGVNYKKMSRGSNNAIFIDAPMDVTNKRITSIDTSRVKDAIDMGLLYDYFKIIGYNPSDVLLMKQDLDNNKTTPQKIKNLLSKEIYDYFMPVRDQKQTYLNKKDFLIERIIKDTKAIKTTVEQNINLILQSFFDNEFYNTFKDKGHETRSN